MLDAAEAGHRRRMASISPPRMPPLAITIIVYIHESSTARLSGRHVRRRRVAQAAGVAASSCRRALPPTAASHSPMPPPPPPSARLSIAADATSPLLPALRGFGWSRRIFAE